jgi:DNA-binding MarR family transcriptional regulator
LIEPLPQHHRPRDLFAFLFLLRRRHAHASVPEKVLDRLESRGLIRRGTRKGDRRAKIIGLTPKGKALQERVALKYSEFVQKSLRVLTKDEQKTLSHIVVKLQKGMSVRRMKSGDPARRLS